MRKNTSGTTNNGNYLIGRGIVYFAEHDSDGRPTAWQDLGNCVDFALNVESETYEHQSSRSGLKVTDLEIPIENSVTASFTLDEASLDNLSRFLSGSQTSASVGTQAGEASATDVEGAGVGQIQGGHWYDIVKLVGTVETRYPDIQQNSDLTLTFTDGTPISLTLGTDYNLDLKFGRVFLIPDSAKVQAAVTAGDQKLQFVLAANASAPATINRITALSKSQVKGALRIISENANVQSGNEGSQSSLTLWNVTLAPNGDFNIISDEAAQMQFTASGTPSNATGRTMDVDTPDYED